MGDQFVATIVYIEDEESIREDVAEELRDAEYNVIEAGNAIEGMRAIKDNRPDLVLCDISMPGMSGLELLAELRQEDSRYNDLPFIFLSALADRGDIIAGKKLGADDYLTKPIDMELLLATVETRLRQVKRMETKKNHQLVKLYVALTGQAALENEMLQNILAGEDVQNGNSLLIHLVVQDSLDLKEIMNTFEENGHNVQRTNSGRAFLDRLEAGERPDMALFSYNTADLAAPLLVKLMRDTYQSDLPVMLLVPGELAEMVGDEQLSLFDGHLQLPCTADECARELLKLLPHEK